MVKQFFPLFTQQPKRFFTQCRRLLRLMGVNMVGEIVVGEEYRTDLRFQKIVVSGYRSNPKKNSEEVSGFFRGEVL